jgi:CSLREA domain-containing protein
VRPDGANFAGARVELFLSDGDASGYGEGPTYLGRVFADGSGNFSSSLTVGVSIAAAAKLTATATDASGNTSEFGANFSGTALDLQVNSTSDEADANPGDGLCQTTAVGVCTLRAAIAEANALPGSNNIVFG